MEAHMRRHCRSFFCCIHSEGECRLLVECARRGLVGKVGHRLTDAEKRGIRPGDIFIYTEEEAQIIRWTDKKTWTPSRVQGVFLAYRDMSGPFVKKTYACAADGERYHVVAYTLAEWEGNGECCVFFQAQMEELRRLACRVFPWDAEVVDGLPGLDGAEKRLPGARKVPPEFSSELCQCDSSNMHIPRPIFNPNVNCEPSSPPQGWHCPGRPTDSDSVRAPRKRDANLEDIGLFENYYGVSNSLNSPLDEVAIENYKDRLAELHSMDLEKCKTAGVDDFRIYLNEILGNKDEMKANDVHDMGGD